MMTAIAIVSLIGYILSVYYNITRAEKIDVDLIIATIVVLSWWSLCFPLAIVILILTVVIGFLGAITN